MIKSHKGTLQRAFANFCNAQRFFENGIILEYVSNFCHFMMLKKMVDIGLIMVYNMPIRYECVITLISRENPKGKP